MSAYYEVRIDCWHNAFKKTLGAKDKPNKRVVRRFLILAEDLDDAEKQAVEYAEKTAGLGPKWVGFEFRESFTRKLPLELKP